MYKQFIIIKSQLSISDRDQIKSTHRELFFLSSRVLLKSLFFLPKSHYRTGCVIDCFTVKGADPAMAFLPVRRISRFFPLFQHHNPAVLLNPLLRLSLSTQSQQSDEEKEIPFIAQYLVSNFRFSPDRALRISSELTTIKSLERLDALVSFLKAIGLSDVQIRGLISFHPILLRLSVNNLLNPQTIALMDSGCTGEIFIQLVLSNPQCLYRKGTSTLSNSGETS
jgi:hypothetical protein